MANVKVHKPQGGEKLVVEDGGQIDLGADVVLAVSGANVVISGLPTSDPGVAGALWVSSNALVLSAG